MPRGRTSRSGAGTPETRDAEAKPRQNSGWCGAMRYQDKKRQLRMNRKQRSAVMQRFIRERPTSEQYTEACQWASARASTIHHRWAIDGSVVAFSPLISCAIFPGALDCGPLPAPLPQRLDPPFHHSSPQSRGWPATSPRKERRKTRRADRRSGYSASSSETETTLAGTVDDRGQRCVRELSKPIRSTRATCWAEVTTTGAQNLEHSGTHRRRSRLAAPPGPQRRGLA
jgi:hypothetical protein